MKLIKNFRSHNAILKFPNERFYDGDLQQCADATTINYYLNSTILPSKKFPVIFHAVSGKDEREASSPSFFNTDEVAVVKSYVEKLRNNRKSRTGKQCSTICALRFSLIYSASGFGYWRHLTLSLSMQEVADYVECHQWAEGWLRGRVPRPGISFFKV